MKVSPDRVVATIEIARTRGPARATDWNGAGGLLIPASPGDSARRSRRGYHFQDLCALRACLAMIDGAWDAVTSDGEEDITCVSSASVVVEYAQVKTEEFPATPWSVARLCEPERAGDRSTSILGRLFSAKPLPDSTRFRLIGNVQLQPALRPLTMSDPAARKTVETTIANRLGGLSLANGRSVSWCVERMWIEYVAGNADALEALVTKDLGFAAQRSGVGLIPTEAEAVLEGILAFVQERARNVMPLEITHDEMVLELARRAESAISKSAAAQAPGAPTLAEKLGGVGVTPEQIQAMQSVHSRFVRAYRAALPATIADFDNLADQIRMLCVELGLRRREGAINPGADLFARTVSAVRELHGVGAWEARGVPLVIANGILHDITARCQHRYD